jgi:hypothetical protein
VISKIVIIISFINLNIILPTIELFIYVLNFITNFLFLLVPIFIFLLIRINRGIPYAENDCDTSQDFQGTYHLIRSL